MADWMFELSGVHMRLKFTFPSSRPMERSRDVRWAKGKDSSLIQRQLCVLEHILETFVSSLLLSCVSMDAA